MAQPTCRFYGMSNVIFEHMRALHPTGGNQCALIFDAHSPCRFIDTVQPPDDTVCPLALEWKDVKINDIHRRT